MLCDSGSEVNYISYRLVQMLQLESEIKETHFRCAGPSGEPLITSGEISLGFTLGSQNYTADFIVVLLAKRTVGILGYQFMKLYNLDNTGNAHYWDEIPELGVKDYYYQVTSPQLASIMVLLPIHRNGFLNIKTKFSLKQLLHKYKISKVFINCTCRIDYTNIQGFLNK